MEVAQVWPRCGGETLDSPQTQHTTDAGSQGRDKRHVMTTLRRYHGDRQSTARCLAHAVAGTLACCRVPEPRPAGPRTRPEETRLCVSGRTVSPAQKLQGRYMSQNQTRSQLQPGSMLYQGKANTASLGQIPQSAGATLPRQYHHHHATLCLCNICLLS